MASPGTVEVWTLQSHTPENVAALRHGLEDAGYRDIKFVQHARADGGLLPWVVVVLVGTSVGAFFKGFFTKAGEDAWKALAQWTAALYRGRTESPILSGEVEVCDEERRVRVVLDAALPQRAFFLLVSEEPPEAAPSGNAGIRRM
jgi:hypothetical protein